MSDIITGIMVKNMAREMVKRATAKNWIDPSTAKKVVMEIKKGNSMKSAVEKIAGKGAWEKISLDELQNIRAEMQAQKTQRQRVL